MMGIVTGRFRTRDIFLVALFLGLFGMAARNVLDPDVWWHLETGRYMIEHKAVPHADPFSFTAAGQRWIAHEWLSELFIYGVYCVSGWVGLIVSFAAIVVAAFLVLYARCNADPYVSGMLVLAGAMACAPLWGVRPQMISLLLASVWLWLLERSEKNLKLLWWTLPLTVLWVNLHAGFALGPALIGLFIVGEGIERLAARRSLRDPRLGILGAALIGCLALVPINPNGAAMFSYPVETLRSKAMQTYIAEWASPNFHRAEYFPFLFLLLASVVALGWERDRIRWRELLLLMVTAFAGLSSIRMIPIFVLVAVPWLVRSIPIRIARHAHNFPRNAAAQVANAAILVAMAVFVGVHTARVIRQQPAAEAATFPAGAVAYLESHPPTGPMFNAYDWGGYLIWKLYPATRVYIDGRADVYGPPLLEGFADTYQFRANWLKTLEQWDIQTLLIPPSCALATGLRQSGDWQIVYEDHRAVIFGKFSR